MHHLERLWGCPPRDMAIKLLNEGMTIDEIAEKMELCRQTILRYTKGHRPAGPSPEKRWFAPDGTPLGEWMRQHGVKTVPYQVVVSRLRNRWPFWDAVYREYHPYRQRMAKIIGRQAPLFEDCASV